VVVPVEAGKIQCEFEMRERFHTHTEFLLIYRAAVKVNALALTLTLRLI
jgi:hypothetical protein